MLRKILSMRDKHHYRKQNPAMQKQLVDRGADLNRDHVITNVFHARDKIAAERLKIELNWRGFRTGVESREQHDDGRHVYAVRASDRLVPDLESLNDMTDRCVEIARAFDSHYRGWHAEPSS